MAPHDCVQDTKIRELCLQAGINREKHRVIEDGFREIFQGDGSMKSRLIEAECGIETIKDTIKSSSKSLMWFLGIMVTIQVAAFGGLALYSSRQAEAPSAVTIQTPHDDAGTDNFGG